MAALAANPTVLALAVGNEIPVDLVRLYGSGKVADTLSRLVAQIHDADPGMLATYVNFPTTEFLEVEGQDLATFNVFLEQPSQLRSYLSHLQVVSGSKPLVMTELGLASEVHGADAQAESLAWQLQTVDEVGCAGATVFSWTDEWAVDDEDVEGWGFGITTAAREARPALQVVEKWATTAYPRDLRDEWPPISVIVNTYNEERNIETCLDSLMATDYPSLEVIVCDDGSTDSTVELARRYPFEVLALPFIGLSAARNAALAEATGDIVAYLDADAACHPDWPYHLALSMEDEGISATGGPNLPFPGAGFIERAVALSPGAPAEVLLTDTRAEHVPGCNVAFRKKDLEAVGAFNPEFTSADDDVDVCWKILDSGREIGVTPAAQVIHRRRDTVRGYLRQQRGYGRAKKGLAGLHRSRFNSLGQARWKGFIYGGSRLLPALFRPVVYTGYQGMAPFQPIVSRQSEVVSAWAGALLPAAVPLAIVGLALGLVSQWWAVVPATFALLSVAYGGAIAMSARVDHREPRPSPLRAIVGVFHLIQPLARAWGRVTGHAAKGNAPAPGPAWAGDRSVWLQDLTEALDHEGCTVRPGGPGNSWDLMATSGLMTSARIMTAIAWKWEPLYRVSYRPRALFWALVVAGVVLGGVVTPWVWAAAIAPVVWLAGSVMWLRPRVRAALTETTEGARQ